MVSRRYNNSDRDRADRANRTCICVLTNFFDLKGNQTIINIDVASDLHNLGDVLVVKPQNFLITLLHE